MKAADARRHGLLQKKRTRQIDTYEDESDARCQLAVQLLDAFDADSLRQPTHEMLAKRVDRFTQLESELETLEQLQCWTERFVDLQMQWVDCGGRLDSDAALRMWDRLDDTIQRAAQRSERRQQLDVFHAELPTLVDKATALVLQQHRQRLQRRGSALSSLDHHHTAAVADQTLAAAGVAPPPEPLAPVELTHQWLPRIIREICASVEQEAAAGRCRAPLVDATRRMLAVIRDRNPYEFFSVLYRSPPENAADPQWVVAPSPRVDAIARLVEPDFAELRELAHWMQAPDVSFWKSFTQLMRCVWRLTIAFHHVMLHLYAIAMQRHDPALTADHVAQEIAQTLAAHASCELQTDGYGLARWLATAEDPILHETFAMFPEVLVYVDQWRHEFSVFEHGFAPSERARDYEVGYNKWKTSKTWLEITHQAKRVLLAWQRARLGAPTFKPLTLQQLGRIEKDVKFRLSKVMDLLYKQNLAKWAQQRYQYSRARVLMELQLLEVDAGISAGGMMKHNVDQAVEAAQAVDTSEASTTKQARFRPPTKSTRRRGTAAKATSPTTLTADFVCPTRPLIDEDDILRWTDDEIDAHEQETERVYELQGGMLAALDKLSLPLLFSSAPTPVEDELDDYGYQRRLLLAEELDDVGAVDGLLKSSRRLRSLAQKAVVQGEEIALHGAAEALTLRPALRISDSPSTSTTDGPPAFLEGTIRESALRLLNLHQAIASDVDAQEAAQKLAVQALDLLRLAQAQSA